jgi:hypothetical protein
MGHLKGSQSKMRLLNCHDDGRDRSSEGALVVWIGLNQASRG